MSYELSHVLQDLILLVDSRMYTGCYLIISVSSGNSSDMLLKGPRSKPEKSMRELFKKRFLYECDLILTIPVFRSYRGTFWCSNA